jgi:RNA polymerase sigma-70 factor (TIGR02957 family)
VTETAAQTHEDLRPLLFSMAYRMVGTVGDAEDLVQEAFLRLHREETEGTEIESPKAFLTTVVTRLAIDHLRSARVRREEYVGEWLPEPLVVDPSPQPDEHAEMSDSLSLAFLVLLESLTPEQRAVFLLHDVFDYGYDEVAAIVEKRPDAVRQIAVRARREIDQRRPRFEASREEREKLADRFFAAAQEGEVADLEALLASDVVLQGDGGGKAPALARALFGANRVARTLVNWRRAGARIGRIEFRRVNINGQPGALSYDADGHLINAMTVDVADGEIQAIRSIVNPDKLAHLGEVVSWDQLLKRQ